MGRGEGNLHPVKMTDFAFKVCPTVREQVPTQTP